MPTPDAQRAAAALVDVRHLPYWLDGPAPDPCPALAGRTSADLAVVGGGYTGLWTALLAKEADPGRDVVLLEARTAGWAASGRNGGFCSASLTHGLRNGMDRFPRELATLERTGHFDAGTATRELLAAGQPLRPSRPGWDGHVDRYPHDGDALRVGPLTVQVLHTPGHTPGGLSLYLRGGAAGHVLTGDTLFPGGPGLTGWPLSDFPTILASVRRLLDLPAGTVVHPGHGPDTTVGAERPALPGWAGRGWWRAAGGPDTSRAA